MNRFIPILVFFIVSCKASYTPDVSSSLNPKVHSETNPEQQIPEWVQKKPTSTSHYIGIGNASLRDTDFHASAKKEALDDLASEISVTIESSSLLHQIENRSGFHESYRANIKSITSQKLSSYELMDSWRSEHQYWVYYRLDKVAFDRINFQKRDRALALAKDNFVKAEEATNTKDLVEALHLYAKSIEALKSYLMEKNEAEIGGKSILLANEAYARILDIIGNIYLKGPGSPIAIEGVQKEISITITALSSIDSSPIKRLPITLEITGHSYEKVTDQKGNVSIYLTRNQTSTSSLRAEINYGFLNKYPTLSSILIGIPETATEISFLSKPLSFRIESNEQNLNKQLDRPILSPLISQILINSGAVQGNERPEYTVEINSETRKGSEISGLFSTYMDFTLAIKNRAGQIEFSDTFSDIKGLHTSFEKAGVKAYQNVEKELTSAIKRSLKKKFFSK